MRTIIKHLQSLAMGLLAFGITSASAQCSLNASFSFTQGSNGQVTLVSTSTGTIPSTSFYWYMGNGQMAYGSSVTYVYPASGNYVIELYASNGPSCTDTIAQPVSVNLGTCVANPNYVLAPTTTAQVWNAIPSNTASVAAAIWSWGDGSTSSTLYTSHQYTAAGNYIICLSLTLTCGHSATNCDTNYVYRSTNNMVTVNVVNASSSVGLKEHSGDNARFIISPNPSNGVFNVNMSGITSPVTRLEVRDITGRITYSNNMEPGSASNKTLDLSSQPAGVYFVQLHTAEGTYSKKILLLK